MVQRISCYMLLYIIEDGPYFTYNEKWLLTWLILTTFRYNQISKYILNVTKWFGKVLFSRIIPYNLFPI